MSVVRLILSEKAVSLCSKFQLLAPTCSVRAAFPASIQKTKNFLLLQLYLFCVLTCRSPSGRLSTNIPHQAKLYDKNLVV